MSILTVLGSLALSRGPHGEIAVAASTLVLTPDEIARVRGMKATAAVSMHYGEDDWSAAQIAGLTMEFKNLGVELIGTTDAGFSPTKQVSDIEMLLGKKPSVIVSIPTDPAATAGVFQKAAKAGVKLVFMDNVPNGMQAGRDYVADVSADNMGSGFVSGHLMARALNCSGQIGLIFHDADFFVTRQRYEGFKSTIQKNYPSIQIVAEKGVTGPDFAGQAQAIASTMLARQPGLKGIWAVWDVPAEGAMAAARAAGRPDLAITTSDLGKTVAISLAKDTMIKGLGAQRPFDQGVVEARLAAYGLLEKSAPPYVTLPVLPVTNENVLQAWSEVYHTEPPAEVRLGRQGT